MLLHRQGTDRVQTRRLVVGVSIAVALLMREDQLVGIFSQCFTLVKMLISFSSNFGRRESGLFVLFCFNFPIIKHVITLGHHFFVMIPAKIEALIFLVTKACVAARVALIINILIVYFRKIWTERSKGQLRFSLHNHNRQFFLYFYRNQALINASCVKKFVASDGYMCVRERFVCLFVCLYV